MVQLVFLFFMGIQPVEMCIINSVLCLSMSTAASFICVFPGRLDGFCTTQVGKGQIKFYNKIALPCKYYLDIYGVFLTICPI